MNIMQILVSGIVLTIVATITLAAVSYAAFKLRQQREPVDGGAAPEPRPPSFEQLRFPPPEPVRDEGRGNPDG